MIKVLPSTDSVLKFMRHPTGRAFRSMVQPVEWPADQFTLRRIADGSVVEPAAAPPPAVAAASAVAAADPAAEVDRKKKS